MPNPVLCSEQFVIYSSVDPQQAMDEEKVCNICLLNHLFQMPTGNTFPDDYSIVFTCLMQYVTARTAQDIIPNLQFVKTLMSKCFPMRGYSSMPWTEQNIPLEMTPFQLHLDKISEHSPNRSLLWCSQKSRSQWKMAPGDPFMWEKIVSDMPNDAAYRTHNYYSKYSYVLTLMYKKIQKTKLPKMRAENISPKWSYTTTGLKIPNLKMTVRITKISHETICNVHIEN